MKISTILDHIDNGHMALPVFQRGYVWNRDQVRGLFDSLYRRHPVGGILVWATASEGAEHRGEGSLAPGVVKLILDGQQRMTSLYGVVRGRPPEFFEGNGKAFTDLRFHIGEETFGFYQPIKMRDDPLWIDVTELMRKGYGGLGEVQSRLSSFPPEEQSRFVERLARLLSIVDIDMHVEEVTGADKTLDVVVDIFNRVNSGGTKLSKGDLALAKICADWPDARDAMKGKLDEWEAMGYDFTLDWLLRSVNVLVTGEARFHYLHDRSADEIREGLKRAIRHIDTSLNLISGRLGLDHDRVLFGRFGIPIMVRYLDQKDSVTIEAADRDRLLFWFVQSGMWGRFSGSTESYLDKDLEALEGEGNGLERLIDQLRLWHGVLRVEPDHFSGWGKGARFYPVLYMLTRTAEACDWGNGLPLKANLLGNMNRLEVHHIFPKSRLYDHGFSLSQVNTLGNFCFQTKGTNLDISNRFPEEYFPEIEEAHPGALASQWIPMDPQLWRIDRYHEFIRARTELLAEAANRLMRDLLHGDDRWLSGTSTSRIEPGLVGGIGSAAEEATLEEVSAWMEQQGLPGGAIAWELVDADTDRPMAIFDLAWPDGIQEELSDPVALLLNEEIAVVSMASAAGFRCFTTVEAFQEYVREEFLQSVEDEAEEVEVS